MFRYAPPSDDADGRKGGSRLSDIAVPRIAPVALCEEMETPREVLFFLCSGFLSPRFFTQIVRKNRGASFVARFMSDETRLRVVYDAECTLCRGARSWVERRDVEGCILFEPANPDTPADVRVLTVQDATGDRLGFDGWVEILRHLPRWGRLAPVLAWRPIRHMGSMVYRVVAAHRNRLPRPS
ncbi:MAG: hypothetical protein DRJ65_12830 [Acidobacteria bacterium]|nr:MAG: hypothetical protein DRJ65_12830 [Acidobacteriota bacterium]